MKYKNLGCTNVKISSIGLGTNFVADIRKNEGKIIYLLQKALNYDINFFDTAENYHNGFSERLIGKAFKKRRSQVILGTKFSPEHSTYMEVLKAAEASLKRLQTDYIDLFQIHWPNSAVPMEETLKALEKLIKSGKVRYLGVSNFSFRQLRNIRKETQLPIVSLQTEYNLLERSIEYDLLPYCGKNKITVIAYTPLNSGNIFKTEKYSRIFSNLSKKYNKTASQIILNFLSFHSTVIPIPATTSLSHLEENAESSEFTLEKKDIRLLEKTFAAKIVNIDTSKIRVATISGHTAYKTIGEAKVNKLNLFPSPLMLSADIQKGDFLKPVRVRVMQKKVGHFEYELLGGRIRYWAYVLAYNGKKPIPAIIED